MGRYLYSSGRPISRFSGRFSESQSRAIALSLFVSLPENLHPNLLTTYSPRSTRQLRHWMADSTKKRVSINVGVSGKAEFASTKLSVRGLRTRPRAKTSYPNFFHSVWCSRNVRGWFILLKTPPSCSQGQLDPRCQLPMLLSIILPTLDILSYGYSGTTYTLAHFER